MKSNNPPDKLVPMSNVEHEYLVKGMELSIRKTEEQFNEICSMPSSDPRAKERAMLSMALSIDLSMQQQILERLKEAE